MKKILLTLALAAASLTAAAQRTPHAIGLHIGGSTIDAEYQYHFNDRNFLDVTAGVFDLGDGFSAQVLYNWNLKHWKQWTPNFATWKVYAGVGGGFGYYDDDGPDYDDFFLGPVGMLGFGFTLRSCPLTVAVDYRPMVAFAPGDGSVIGRGFRNIGLTITYRF